MQMQLDGSFGDIEFASNCFVGEALGGKKRDLALAHAQHVEVRGILYSIHRIQSLHIKIIHAF